jgi:hypothetical protein
MFCPSCGAQSLPNQHFCKSCGTDLDLVSTALNKRETAEPEPTPPVQTADLATLNNQIARGYKDVVTGGGLLLAIFVVLVLLHERGWAIWLALWFLIWGCGSLAKGIGNVLAARHILSNLRSQPLPSQARTTGKAQTSPIPYQPPAARTDQSDFHKPESVTEQTTRKLENPESSAAERCSYIVNSLIRYRWDLALARRRKS